VRCPWSCWISSRRRGSSNLIEAGRLARSLYHSTSARRRRSWSFTLIKKRGIWCVSHHPFHLFCSSLADTGRLHAFSQIQHFLLVTPHVFAAQTPRFGTSYPQESISLNVQSFFPFLDISRILSTPRESSSALDALSFGLMAIGASHLQHLHQEKFLTGVPTTQAASLHYNSWLSPSHKPVSHSAESPCSSASRLTQLLAGKTSCSCSPHARRLRLLEG
jgi:hypothetical protein